MEQMPLVDRLKVDSVLRDRRRKVPHILRPLRFIKSRHVDGDAALYEARAAADAGDGKRVQDIARRVYARTLAAD